PLKHSIIVDISGGGLRFVANQKYDEVSLIYCKYYLTVNGMNKEYNLVGKILHVSEIEKQKGNFEHRVQYINIDSAEREEIIRYIFEEERKNLRRDQKKE
ncbi:MAG: PilZ domain-containing protein, partial [Lachnospiraceae bacterium]|nr:PilZ domain-containing protein [Lachnospiraceae bacterium]